MELVPGETDTLISQGAAQASPKCFQGPLTTCNFPLTDRPPRRKSTPWELTTPNKSKF